jgi:hypothetical protein
MHKTMARTTMGVEGPLVAMKRKLVKVPSFKIMAMLRVG